MTEFAICPYCKDALDDSKPIIVLNNEKVHSECAVGAGDITTGLDGSVVSVPGVNVLLMGPPGTGKTHVLRTLIDAGIKDIFCIFTEPGMEVMADTRVASEAYRKALKENHIHWKYVAPAQSSWAQFQTSVRDALTFDIGTLQKRVAVDKQNQFLNVLQACENFKCDRCKQEFGNVDDWGVDRALVFDSLSGLNVMLLGMAAGSKPVITQPEWGQAMKMEEAFINRLSLGLQCHFIMCAHVDRQTDMLSGGVKQMPSALGQKLPPVISRFFSDVILTVKEGDKFTWTTSSSTSDTKARNIINSSKLEPSFVPIIKQWRANNAI